MRKISLLLIICIVLMNISGTVTAQESAYVPTIRVGISYGDKAVGEGWFYSDSPIEVIDATYSSYVTTIPGGLKFKITAMENMLFNEYFSPTASHVRLESASFISYNDNEYRGSFELYASGGTVTVINVINTEDYLASVLGKEMSITWPIEALKAQAVCARNYAIKNLGKHALMGFDICNTQDCQVYGGVSSEGAKTLQAVRETEGVLVTYQGKVVPLFYFSCDGGYTENSENVWIAAEGYLRGKKDIYEKQKYATYYNWTQQYTKEEIESILISKNINIGSLLDIRIDKLSENNGVIELTFVGTEGEKTVTKTSTRTTLGLKSQAYTIEKHVTETEKSDNVERVVQNVLTGNGMITVLNPEYALTANGICTIPYEKEASVDETAVYSSYTFTGHGWGHLVGMSQWGAYSMAMDGFSYKDILSFYFTDIAIVENSYSIERKDDAVIEEIVTEEIPTETVYEEIQWSDTGI